MPYYGKQYLTTITDEKPEKSLPKTKKPLNKVSKKREAENKIYAIESKEFIKGEKCYIEGCNKSAEGIDHQKGRWGKNFLDKKYWKPCCNSHNQELENNSELKKKYHISKISGKPLNATK